MRAIDAGVLKLHQFAWQPARFAHRLWILNAGVKPEAYHYGRCPTLDRTLNRYLIRLRGFPCRPLPAVLTHQQQVQIALAPRIDALCMALGLISLRCADYLRIRCYREALAPVLTDNDLRQLLGIGCPGYRLATLSPKVLPDITQQLGQGFFSAIASSTVIWQALSILLPPFPRALHWSAAALWLARLERFL